MDIAHIPPRVAAVIRWVAFEHQLPVEALLGRSQVMGIADARRMAIRGVRCMTMADGKPPSLPRIGRWFGRHHTTILHYCRGIDSLDGEQPDLFEIPISVNRPSEVVAPRSKRESMAA